MTLTRLCPRLLNVYPANHFERWNIKPEACGAMSRWWSEGRAQPPVHTQGIERPESGARKLDIFSRTFQGADHASAFRWFRCAPPPANVWQASGLRWQVCYHHKAN